MTNITLLAANFQQVKTCLKDSFEAVQSYLKKKYQQLLSTSCGILNLKLGIWDLELKF
ncbi:hypothetical protein [Sunxiuqinia sp. sy24]|uniref:hypothetical protein n=1 Tax=Sunxiuqinia sp. sy24 TaxID=3461495 RepID=UPI004045D9F8